MSNLCLSKQYYGRNINVNVLKESYIFHFPTDWCFQEAGYQMELTDLIQHRGWMIRKEHNVLKAPAHSGFGFFCRLRTRAPWIRSTHKVWEMRDHGLGWKRPLRSLSPSIKMTEGVAQELDHTYKYSNPFWAWWRWVLAVALSCLPSWWHFLPMHGVGRLALSCTNFWRQWLCTQLFPGGISISFLGKLHPR